MSKTNPCSECPFRKNSLPGYVGDHDGIEEISLIVESDHKFACHQEVNAIQDFLIDSYEDASLRISEKAAFDQAVREAPHCVGALVYLNNRCKLSRDPEIAKAQKALKVLGKGKRDDVFASKQELEAHHNRFTRVKL